MLKWFRPEYRIVQDFLYGYEVQKRVWWCPIWTPIGYSNSHCSVEEAEDWLARKLKREAWSKYLGRL
jgi:hypothetical protein